MPDARLLHQETRVGWDRIAATKYRAELSGDISFLREGGHTFLPIELDLLRPHLSGVRHAIHLQCSHGLDSLGLLNLGVERVTGIDISPEMIRLAEEKTRALGANAQWVCADLLDTPVTLDGSADLILTGKGALPWILDLEGWARVVTRLLRPGGLLYLFEGHPLAALWDRQARTPVIQRGTPGYFGVDPLERPGFPADAATPLGPRPPMREQYWRPGQVLASLRARGLIIEHFDEYPEAFWDQFPHWSADLRGLLPMTYSVLARHP